MTALLQLYNFYSHMTKIYFKTSYIYMYESFYTRLQLVVHFNPKRIAWRKYSKSIREIGMRFIPGVSRAM